jgi:hypothetical protein
MWLLSIYLKMWTETLQLHKHSTYKLTKVARTCLIILASSDPCLFYGSWCELSTSLPWFTLSSCKKLNSPRSEENKPGQSQWVLPFQKKKSQWVLAQIVMYLWHSHASLLLLPLQFLQKHILFSSSPTTFQKFPCWVFDVLCSLCTLQPVKGEVFHWSINLQVKFASQFLFSCLPNRLNSLTRYEGFFISWSLKVILQNCLFCISVFRVTTNILVPSNFVVQTCTSSISFTFTIHSSVILMSGFCMNLKTWLRITTLYFVWKSESC